MFVFWLSWCTRLTERRGCGIDCLRCNIGRRVESGKETAVQLERDVGFFEDLLFQVLIVADTCVHSISVPLLNLLHIPNRAGSISAELFKVVKAQTSTVFKIICLGQSSPDELSAAQVPQVPDVRMSEKGTRVRRIRERL